MQKSKNLIKKDRKEKCQNFGETLGILQQAQNRDLKQVLAISQVLNYSRFKVGLSKEQSVCSLAPEGSSREEALQKLIGFEFCIL